MWGRLFRSSMFWHKQCDYFSSSSVNLKKRKKKKKRQQWQMLNPFTITHAIHQNSNDSCNHDDFWTRWHKKSGTHSSLDTREIQSAKCAILCSGNKTRHQKPQLLLCCVGPVWLTRAVRSAVRRSNSWREDRPFNTLQIYEYKTHWDKRDPSLGSLCVPAFKIHQGGR